MLAIPRNHGWVSGTGTSAGNGSTSLISVSSASQLCPPAWNPRREAATLRASASAMRVIRSCWKSTRLSAMAAASAERLDLADEILRLYRLHDVILRALPQPPELVGLLPLGGADDHRDVLGRLVGGE